MLALAALIFLLVKDVILLCCLAACPLQCQRGDNRELVDIGDGGTTAECGCTECISILCHAVLNESCSWLCSELMFSYNIQYKTFLYPDINYFQYHHRGLRVTTLGLPLVAQVYIF